jgi:hypothetical protein
MASEKVQSSVYSASPSNSKLAGFNETVISGLFLAAGDLALDLRSEFQRVSNLLERFRSATGAPNDNRSVAEQSPHRGLFHDNTFNSRQEKFEGAAAGEAGFYDHSLVSEDHHRGVALDEADSKKDCCDEKRCQGEPNQNIGMSFGVVPRVPGEQEKSGACQNEKGCETGVAEHDDPMQFGLIFDRFPLDEVFFSVTQSSSLRARDAIRCVEYCLGL